MKEGEIQSAFRLWLDRNRISYLCPTFGKKSRITPGWPDFTLIHCGRVLLIESKTEKGPLSDVQKELFPILARENGTVVQICRSVEEHIRTAQEWLGAISALPTLGTQKDASTGIPEGKEGQSYVMPPIPDGHKFVTVASYPDGRKELITSPVNGAATPTTKTPDPILTAFVQAKAEEIDAEIMGAGPVNGTARAKDGEPLWMLDCPYCKLAHDPAKTRCGYVTQVDGTPMAIARASKVAGGQAFLDNIPYVSERIDDWEGQRWLTRQDKRGQWYFVRRATNADAIRVEDGKT